MMSFIGADSVRAANAGAAAADAGKFKPFHDVLFANQPTENTGGYSNDKLIQFGAKAGLTSSDFKNAVNDGKCWKGRELVSGGAARKAARAGP